MNAAALVIITILSFASSRGLVFFANHRYGQSENDPHRPKGYSGIQSQMMKERQEHLMRFIVSEPGVLASDDFKPKDVIGPSDVVGVLPSNVFKIPNKETSDYKKRPEIDDKEPDDAETGESQNIPTYKNLWNKSQLAPTLITNHKYTESSPGLFEKPYGRVRVHTYRGPVKEYWKLSRKAEPNTYSQWGYFVKQPVGSETHKFHSPLDLSFNFE